MGAVNIAYHLALFGEVGEGENGAQGVITFVHDLDLVLIHQFQGLGIPSVGGGLVFAGNVGGVGADRQVEGTGTSFVCPDLHQSAARADLGVVTASDGIQGGGPCPAGRWAHRW